jgi:DeoR/GlpR family transcriptional regulator of sugar metabolism
VDHTRSGQVPSCRVCAIGAVDAIITDAGAGDDLIAPFAALGIELVRV